MLSYQKSIYRTERSKSVNEARQADGRGNGEEKSVQENIGG